MSKAKRSTPILKAVAAFLVLIATAALFGPQAQGQTAAGNLLIDLDASTLTAGALASWTNEGSLGGAFTSSTANPVVETVQGVSAVTFANTWLKSNFLTTADFTGGSDWSVELWAINPSVGGDEGMLTWSNRGEDNQNAACAYSTAAGWGAFAGWGPGDIGYVNAIPPTAGIWHHITYTYAGGANAPLTIYVDGVQNNQANKSLNIHGPGDTQAMPVMLGGSTGGDATGLAANVTEQWFTGSLSKVRIHNGALSAADVLANYNLEKTAYLAPALMITAPVSYGLYYGSVPLNTDSAPQTVTIKNAGTTDLTFGTPAASVTGAAAAEYQIVPGFDTTPLAPGATRTIQVLLHPTSASFKVAQLVFNTNSAVTVTPIDLLGGTPTVLDTAGALLVDLKMTGLAVDTQTTWTNEGTLGGNFINPTGSYPQVGTIQGVQAVGFNRTWLKSDFLSTADFTGNSDWSLETWVYNPYVDGEEQVVTWSNRGEENKNAAFLYGTSTGWGAFGGWGAGDMPYLNAIPPVGGTWHQVTVTYAGGANSPLKVYVDGRLNNTGSKNLSIHGPGDAQAMPIILGGSTGDNPNGLNANAEGWWYTGAMAAVRFHDNALTAAQVYSNYLCEQADYSGTMQVNITPAEAVAAGVQWRFATDAPGTWRNSGDTVTIGGAQGQTIEYKAVAGWQRRPDEKVAVTAGQATVVDAFVLRQGAPLVYVVHENASIQAKLEAFLKDMYGQNVEVRWFENDDPRLNTFRNKNRAMTAAVNTALVAELNAANLIIFSRNISSGDYASNDEEKAAWDAITTPMIIHSGHQMRSTHWNLVNSTTMAALPVQDIDVVDAGDPLFNGVAINGGKVRIYNVPTKTDLLNLAVATNVVATYNNAGTAIPVVMRWNGTETNYYAGSPRGPKGPRVVWISPEGVGALTDVPSGGDFLTSLTPAGLQMYRNALTQYVAIPSVNVQALNFGLLRLGGAAVSKTAVITNQSAADLTISAATLTGNPEFAITSMKLNEVDVDLSAPVTLNKAAGDKLEITVAFTPSVESKRLAQITLTTNDPNYAATTINLTGVATTWVGESINGNPGTLNSMYVEGSNKIKIVSSGGDIWNNADQCYFAYKKLSGDGEIIARVDYLDSSLGSGDWTKAGIDIRETPAGGSKRVFIGMVTGGTPGTQVVYRTYTNLGCSDQTDRWPQRPPQWLRLKRVGNVITPAFSEDGIMWQWRAPRTVEMSADVYVGLAATSNNNFGNPIRADYSNITITGNVSNVETQGLAPSTVAIAPSAVAFGTLEPAPVTHTRTLKISNTASPFVNARNVEVAAVTKTLGDAFTVGQPMLNKAAATLPAQLLPGGGSVLEIPITINATNPGTFDGMLVVLVDGVERGIPLAAKVSEPAAYTNPVTDGLAFAVDASVLTGLNAGDPVSSWPDLSGNGNDAIMAEPSRRPIYFPNASNGLPALRFDGGNDYLNTSALPANWPASETTVFAVSRAAVDNANIFQQVPDVTTNRFGVEMPWSGNIYWDFGGDAAPGRLAAATNALPQPHTNFNVWAFAASPLIPGQTIRENNQLVASDNNADILDFVATASLRIGNRSAGGDALNGDIAELLIYNRSLSAEETNAVGFYLQNKYGTPFGYVNPAAVPQLAVNPIASAYGTFGSNDAAKSVNFTIQNAGSGDATLDIASVVSTSPAFQITSAVYTDANIQTALSAPYTASLQGNLAGSVVVTVAFDPAGKTPGGYAGMLQIASNDATRPLVELPLTALVTAAPVGSGLMIHLDASQIDATNPDMVEVAPDGTQRVRKWLDLSPTGRTATQVITEKMPQYVPNALNGLPAVRFDGLNNSGDFLSYTRIAGRTFILVMKETIKSDSEPRKTFIGDSSSADFHRGPRNMMVDRPNGWSASQVRNGDAWLNGQWIDCTTELAPTQYSVLTFRTLSNASTDQLARDRTYGDRFWAGDVAEYLVYDRPLSADELNTIGYYLQQKYLPAQNHFVPTTETGALWVTPQTIAIAPTQGQPMQYNTITIKRAGAEGTTQISSLDTTQLGLFAIADVKLNGETLYTPFAATLTNADELVVRTSFDPSSIGTFKGKLIINSDDAVRPAAEVSLTADVVGLQVKNGLTLHLDATRIDKTDPWQVTNSGGQNYVRVWRDLSGTKRDAVSSVAMQQPILVENAVNGLPVVRLDGINNEGDYMHWWPENRNLRTVFMVMKENTNTNDGANRHILTSADSTDFHRGAGTRPAMISTEWASANLMNAPASAINGVAIDLKTTPPPTDMKILSITTAGDSIAGGIGRDRTYNDRYFAGDYAEILLYDRVLNEWETNAVGYYLAAKYNMTDTSYTLPTAAPAVPAAIEVTPNVLDLGTVAPDAGLQSGVLKIRNVGPSDTTLNLSNLDFSKMGKFQVTEVLLNGTTPLSAPYVAALSPATDDYVEIRVTFDPSTAVAGSHGGWFLAYSDDPARPDVSAGVSATVAGLDATAWRAQDVGDPALKGSFELQASGAFRLVAAGSDIWGNKDEMHYAYKGLYGDGSITARVVAMNLTQWNDWAKCGVMIRESLNGGSANAATLKAGGNGAGVNFQRRYLTDQGSSGEGYADLGRPMWVRLVRQGNVFNAYHSVDGVVWSRTYPPQTIVMPRMVYVGLGFTSHESNFYGEAIVDNVTLTGGVFDYTPEEITADPIDVTSYPYRVRMTTVGFNGLPVQKREVLVKLGAATVADFTSTTFTSAADGADLRFVAADKTTPLPFKIVSWNPAGESSIWVRVDELTDADSHFYAIWGSTDVTTPTYNNISWNYSPAVPDGFLSYTRVITDGQTLLADAGVSTATLAGVPAQLGGTSSTQHVLYNWTVVSTPADPQASVTFATTKSATTQATFAPDVLGAYVLQLTVSDDFNTPSTSTVTINVTNDEPVVNAGADIYANAGAPVQLNGTMTDQYPGDAVATWSLQGPGSWTFVEGTANTLNPKVQFPDANAVYTVRLTADDGQGGVAFDELTVYVAADNGVIYVDQDVTSSSLTGLDWANACQTIAQGLQMANKTGAKHVWVASGLYNESVTLASGIQLMGGFAGTESSLAERNLAVNQSTINGAGAAHVVTMNNVQNARLDGFTVTGGVAFAGGENSKGAGVYANLADDTNVIANCEISGNRADVDGGGIYLYGSSPFIVNCVIAGNEADNGAAVFARMLSEPTITNCTIADNRVMTKGAIGLMEWSAPILTNNIFAGNPNVAVNEVAANSAAAGLVRNLFWQNGTADYYDFGATDPNLIGGAVNTLPAAAGNRGGDPLFAMGVTGAWTAAPEYDGTEKVTTLVNSGAALAPNSLVGSFIQTSTSLGVQAYIVENTATEIVVLGDLTAFATTGTLYQVTNYALTAGSAAADVATATGAPGTDIIGVVRPVNGANDIGAYELPNAEDIVVSSLDFGKQVAGAGATATPLEALIKNNGSAPVTITSIGLIGPDAARFSIVSGDDTGVLAVGATQAVSLVFDPAVVGAHLATLAVQTAATSYTGSVTGIGTPAIPTGLDLAAATDTGASDTDNVTTLSVVTISATGPAGAQIRLFDEGGLVFADTAARFAAGVTLDFNASSAIAVEGPHNLTVTAYDTTEDVESAPSAPLLIVVDQTAPSAPYGINLAASDDSGVSNSDRITNQLTDLTLYGAADFSNPNTSVQLSEGATALTSGTALQFVSGLDVSFGAAGAHPVTAVAIDLAGNASAASAPVGLLIDQTPAEVASAVALTASPARATTVEFGVQFTDPVYTFDDPLTDVVVNTTGVLYTAVAITPVSLSEYIVTVDGITSSGIMTITVPPNAAIDVAGNPNTLAVESTSVTIDNAAVPILIAEPFWTAGTENAVAWKPMTGATSYTLLRTLDNNTSPALETLVLSASTTSHTFTGLTDGTKYYYFLAALLEGETSLTAWSAPVFSTQDATNPAAELQINGGAAYATNSVVTLNLSANDTQGAVVYSGVAEMRTDSGSGWSAWRPYAATQSLNLLGDDGIKVVQAQVRDLAQNLSAVTSASIILDRVSPTGTIVPLEAGPMYGTTATYVVTFSELVTGFAGQANNLVLTATPLPNAAPITYTTVTIEAQSATTYHVTVAGLDGSGNLALSVPAGLAIDVAGNANVAFGPSANVVIDHSVPTLVAEPLWTPSDMNTIEWLDLFNTTTYTLQVATDKDFTAPTEILVVAPATSQDVTNLVDGTTYWYRLQANKSGMLTAWSDATSSTQDATLPTGTIQIGDGATTFTTTNDVELTLAATDPLPAAGLASGVKDMRFSEDGSTTWTAWEAYATSRAWTFSAAADGVRTVTVEFRDNAGNTKTATASITVDLGRPAVVSTTPALLGPTNADSINTQVVFSEPVQGLDSASDLSMELNGVTIGSFAFAGATSDTLNSTFNVSLGGIDGDGTFTLTVNESAAFDSVGNMNTAGVASAVVTIDNTAPVLGPLTGTKVVNSSNFVIRWPVVKDPSGINPYVYDIATDSNFATIVKSGTLPGVTLIYAGTEGVTYWVRVRAEDKAGNVGAWAVDWVLYDNTAPTATITALTAGPTSNTAEFLVAFSEPVTGFQDLADVTTTYTGTVANTATTITALSQTEYVVTLSGLTGVGSVAISVPSGAAKNQANLDNVAFGPSAFVAVAEFVAPVLTAEPVWTGTAQNAIAWTTATFATAYVAESATDAGFTAGVTSQTVTGLTATFANLTNGQTYWYRVKATDGVIETGWSNVTSTTIDLSAPSVTITSTVSDPTSMTAIPITIAFSEPVTDFTSSDIVAVGATVTSFTALSATTYTAVLSVTLTQDGVVTADIAAGVAVDAANTPNTAAAQFKINYKHYVEPTAPTVVLTSTVTVTNVSPIPVTATFDQDVTGFEAADLVTVNGTVADFTAVSATVYTFNVTPAADGTVTVNVPAGVATSLADKANVASNLLAVVYDTTAPTVAMTSLVSDPTTATVIPMLVTFSEPVTGFTADDIVASNATVADFTVPANGDGTTYTANLNVTLTQDGMVVANIAGAVAVDLAGNPNTNATQFTRNFVATVPPAPQPVITTTAPNPTSASPIPVTVTFDLAVTGFEAGDVVVTNGAVSNFAAVSATVYTFDVTPAADGEVTVSVPAGAALSTENAASLAAVPLVVVYTNPAPIVVLSSSVVTTSATLIPVTATFSEAVTGFTAEDVVVPQGVTVANFVAGANNTFTFDLQLALTADTVVTAQIPAGACVDSEGKANEASNLLSVQYIYVEVTPLTVVLSAGVTTTSERSIPVTATFSEAVTGFGAEDLMVQGATVANFAMATTGTYTFDLQVTLDADGPVTVQVPTAACVNAQNTPNQASNLLSIGYVYDINFIPLPAPTGVIASDGVYTYKTRVEWAAVEGASFYKVYRTLEVTIGTAVLQEVTGWISTLSIDDQTAEPGVKYLYQVRAASTEQGGRQSELSAADLGWIAAASVPATAWYKIQYANCTLDPDSTSVSLAFTGTGDKSTVKIQLLPKGKPANAADVAGKIAYRELAKLESFTVDGNLKSFYSQVDIESFEATGLTSAIKSLTTKNANISFISAAQLGTVKIDVAKHSTGTSPEFPSTSIYTTGDLAVGAMPLTAKVQLTGTILADLDMEQTLSYIKAATKKYTVKVNGVKEYRVSLGGIGPVLRVVNDVTGQQPAEPFPMGSNIRAQKITSISVSGSSIVPDLIDSMIQKITTVSGYYKVTNTGSLPAPVKVSNVVVAGNIRVTQIVSSDTLKTLQAKAKVLSGVPYGGLIGTAGQTGYPLMTVLAPNFGTIAGKGGVVSGIFIAGYNKVDLPSGPHYSPNYTGAIKKIDATKTGQLWGAAYMNPALVAKLKLMPAGSTTFQVNPAE